MRGTGSALFVGILLIIAGVLNIVYGIAAVGNSHFYVATIILGIIQLTGAFSLFAGNIYGRVIGLIAATLGAIEALFNIGSGSSPWWSLAVFAVCVVIIHGLVVLGEPEEA